MCDGRSPGSRFFASSAFPVTGTSGIFDVALRLQLRGQPWIYLLEDLTMFPLRPPFGRTIIGDLIFLPAV